MMKRGKIKSPTELFSVVSHKEYCIVVLSQYWLWCQFHLFLVLDLWLEFLFVYHQDFFKCVMLQWVAM